MGGNPAGLIDLNDGSAGSQSMDIYEGIGPGDLRCHPASHVFFWHSEPQKEEIMMVLTQEQHQRELPMKWTEFDM